MFSHLSDSLNLEPASFSYEENLPFNQYVEHCRTLILAKRKDLLNSDSKHTILEANSPFEYYPDDLKTKPKAGALLIHGLLDSPFSLRDTAVALKKNGILSKAILLPGHGTTPKDLLSITYQDWIKAVEYGVAALKKEVDHIFLIGYSTGAALSIYNALNDKSISGLILLAPAIKIKAPVDLVVAWHKLIKVVSKKKKWLYMEDETDYAKYQSIAFNPVSQVSQLTNILFERVKKSRLSQPVFVALSREDETISSHSALDFFMTNPNPANKMLLYTSCEHAYPDKRIMTRNSQLAGLKINHLSHIAMPFTPDNKHYGQTGDYPHASHLKNPNCFYGAYNRIEVNFMELLYKLALLKQRRQTLTYNPDFEYLANAMVEFIHEHSR